MLDFNFRSLDLLSAHHCKQRAVSRLTRSCSTSRATIKISVITKKHDQMQYNRWMKKTRLLILRRTNVSQLSQVRSFGEFVRRLIIAMT